MNGFLLGTADESYTKLGEIERVFLKETHDGPMRGIEPETLD